MNRHTSSTAAKTAHNPPTTERNTNPTSEVIATRKHEDKKPARELDKYDNIACTD
jgi:hypothetical protein